MYRYDKVPTLNSIYSISMIDIIPFLGVLGLGGQQVSGDPSKHPSSVILGSIPLPFTPSGNSFSSSPNHLASPPPTTNILPLLTYSHSIMPISFPHHSPLTPYTKGTPPAAACSGPLANPGLFTVHHTESQPSLGLLVFPI